MVFNFSVLGVLILLLIVILHFLNNEKDKLLFSIILCLSYVLQLIYILTFISLKGSSYNLFGRIYFVLLVIMFNMLSMYNLGYIIRNKYKNSETTICNKKKIITMIFIITSFISTLLVLGSKMYMIDNRLVFGNNIINIILSITIIVDVLILIYGRNIKLYTLLIAKIFMLFSSLWVPSIDAINPLIVFSVVYIYLVLDNYYLDNLNKVKLERDYAIRNTIDKYAFLKNLSHEIRTPINTIDGFSQVILDSDKLDVIKEDIKDIRLASKELIDTINNTIDLSIIESGNLEIINDNYNVYDMMDNIYGITTSKLKDKKVEFIYNVEKNIPEILLGDSERISQVILNIIGNSIKFTEKGSITLDVSSVKSSDRVRLIIKVIDTGIGIKKEDLIHIFDKNNDSIGLLLSNYLIKMMNGKIDVESTYNEGTTFVITIDQKIIMEHATKIEKNTKPFMAEDKKILIVDDNKLNLKVATKLLEPYKVQVTTLNSGKECLDVLDRDTDFDLILMDDLMPNMSGTETMDIIKKIARIDGFYIPIVVLTANATSGDKEKYLDAGFDDYLAKPIEKKELNRVLKKYLKGKKKNSD